jgi:hypothetical protein
MLGGSSAGDGAPADLDSVLSMLPPEDAARWRETIEADAQRQASVVAAQQAGGQGEASDFSDAYSALRMASGRGASGSGLLELLGAGEGVQG